MAPGARRIKRESTVKYGGLITPDESMCSAGSVTPKREIDVCSVSDVPEDAFPGSSINQHHGLPVEEDEGYSSLVVEQQRRSLSVSVRTSQPPPPSRHSKTEQTPDMVPITRDQGLEFVGLKVKLLVDAINDLRQFGLDHVVQLPELVLVGDQSAGKSSLMSALTEVQLPRDQGTCTRCPANIKTSPANTWSCKISLQQYFRYDNPRGRVIDSRSVTQRNPFPPWVEQILEVKEFMTIYDKSDLEKGIKWAQIALLNHDQDYHLFIPGSGMRAQDSNFQREREETEAKFSPNLIAIEISGPDLPALSFYDLPGIFRVTPDPRDQYLAKVIENLATKYIKRPNALIIWTLAMKTDPSNSSTGKLIQDCKASNRCIGVLTNPDHVAVRHVEYEKILQGKAHIVGHGYFVTKQPGEDSQLQGPSYHSQAREEESRFFDSQELWTGEWKDFRPRCGTTAIQKYLSLELARQIMDSIPSITEKIEQRAREVDINLAQFPDLPDSDILNVVTRCLAQFSTDVRSAMNGDLTFHGQPGFQGSWSALSDQFRDLILHIKPMINLRHESDLSEPEIIDLLSDDEGSVDMTRPSTPANKRQDPFTDQSPSQRQRVMTPGQGSAGRVIQTNQTGNSVKREAGQMQAPPRPQIRRPLDYKRNNPFVNTPFEKYAFLGKGFVDLAGIRTYIADHRHLGKPGLVNEKTHNEICLLSVNPWKSPLEVFMDETHEILRKQITAIFHKNLGLYEQTELYRAAMRHIHKFVDEHVEEQRKSLRKLYHLETYEFFTVNQASFLEHQAREFKILADTRDKVRAMAFVERQIKSRKMQKPSSELSFEERKKEIEKRAEEVTKKQQLPKDSFDLELRVAAYVRGYYTTAAHRFIDSVCLSMNGELFRNIREKIWFYLEKELGITVSRDGEEVCRGLMEEDDIAGRRRRELRQEKEKLTGFSRRLATLLEQVQDVDSVLEQQYGDGHSSFNASYRQPHAPSVSSDEDVEMSRDGDDSGASGRTLIEIPTKRPSNSSSVVEFN